MYLGLCFSLPVDYLVEHLIQLSAINIITLPLSQKKKVKANFMKVTKVMDFTAKFFEPSQSGPSF